MTTRTVTTLTRADLEIALMSVPDQEARDALRARYAMPGQYVAVRQGALYLGCGGITRREEDPHLGEPWALLTTTGIQHYRATYRAILVLLPILMRSMDLTALQMLVRSDHQEGHRLARHLGATLAWPMYQAGHGATWDLYRGTLREGEAIGRQ